MGRVMMLSMIVLLGALAGGVGDAGGAAGAGACTLMVELPEGMQKPASAVATARELKLDTAGLIDGRRVRFEKLLPDTAYDLTLTLADGTSLCGVDLSWYNDDPPADNPGELTDDDREQIQAIAQKVPQFYTRCDIHHLRGDHDRAVMLASPIRDTAFHSDKGGEVIWRVELWYFKNQNGGWERISQQNKVLRRERFPSKAAFEAATKKLRWLPELGGIRLSAEKPGQLVKLTDIGPATRPAGK